MMLRCLQRDGMRARELEYLIGPALVPEADDYRKPVVIDGDPEKFATMVDRWNTYSQSHFSCVLSLAERLPQNQAHALVDEFYDVLLPGRRPGQYLTVAVQHEERVRGGGTRTGLHVSIFSTDLLGHRNAAIYWPARDRRRMEAWVEFNNLLHGWRSPKERARELRATFAPRIPGASELVARLERKLPNLGTARIEDIDEIRSTLSLAGARHIEIDRTSRGRLRVRCTLHLDEIVRVSMIAPERVDVMRRSTLRSILPGGEFRRDAQAFRALQACLAREVLFAADRRRRIGITDFLLEELDRAKERRRPPRSAVLALGPPHYTVRFVVMIRLEREQGDSRPRRNFQRDLGAGMLLPTFGLLA